MSIHIPSSEGEAVTAEVRTNLPDVLPILPLRDSVPFPETLTPLAIGQERSIQLINDVLAGNRMLAMVASKDAEDEEPGPDGIYGVGVAGWWRACSRCPTAPFASSCTGRNAWSSASSPQPSPT